MRTENEIRKEFKVTEEALKRIGKDDIDGDRLKGYRDGLLWVLKFMKYNQPLQPTTKNSGD